MAAQPRPRIEGHEAIRFAGRRVNHFPHVQPQFVAHQSHFVDEANVDGAEGVLEEFDHLGRGCAGNGHGVIHDGSVESHGRFQASRRNPTNHFGGGLQGVIGAAGVNPFGREGEEEITADFLPFLLQDGQHHLVGRAGIGGAFQNNQLAFHAIFGDVFGGVDDVGDVGVFGFAEGGGDANGDGIHIVEQAVIYGGAETAVFNQLGNRFVGNVFDIALAIVQGLHFARIHINASDVEARLGQPDHKGQANVT